MGIGMTDMVSYFNADNEFVGVFPLYYFGAKPTEPQFADSYFCSVDCANEYHKLHILNNNE